MASIMCILKIKNITDEAHIPNSIVGDVIFNKMK